MKPVIRYLKSLKLKETDEHLSNRNEKGELLYGLNFISFDKADGTEICFMHNHAKLTLTGDTPKSYVLDGAETDSNINLNLGLQDAFAQIDTDTEK